MSAWRREGIRRLPRLRRMFEEAEALGQLWIDLYLEFEDAHRKPLPDDELIGGIYDYAFWCLTKERGQSAKDDASTIVCVSFFEHLPMRRSLVRKHVHRWIPPEHLEGLREIFAYHESRTGANRFIEECRQKWLELPATEQARIRARYPPEAPSEDKPRKRRPKRSSSRPPEDGAGR